MVVPLFNDCKAFHTSHRLHDCTHLSTTYNHSLRATIYQAYDDMIKADASRSGPLVPQWGNIYPASGDRHMVGTWQAREELTETAP